MSKTTPKSPRKDGPKERRFLDALRDLFVGAKVDGESGYINLMRIKASYFTGLVEPTLMEDIAAALKEFPEFREEMFDKLHAFFSRYFSRSGSICFAYTPNHFSVYEKVYTDEQDVVLFWKTHMLFIPDFVFWGQKGEDYTILFVDPKGMENQNWERKADGYIRLFEEDGVARNFEMEGVRVSVRLSFFTRDRNHASEGGYQRFWMDNAKELFASSFP